MTNREKYNDKTEDQLLDIAQDNGLHDLCDKYMEKNLSPSNPCCEGAWCDRALELWLDMEAN